MYERNDYDLPFAEHKLRVEAANRHGWRVPLRPGRAYRPILARWLRALAGRIEPTSPPARPAKSATIGTSR